MADNPNIKPAASITPAVGIATDRDGNKKPVHQAVSQGGATVTMFPANEDDITPDDDVDLDPPCQAVRCEGDAGDIVYVTVGGQERTKTVAAGDWLPVQVRQVKATGTTATGLVGFW